MDDQRRCVVCGEAIGSGTRQTCGKACADTLMWRKRHAAKPHVYPARTCPGCGQALLPREGEPPSVFMHRKTCGMACGRKATMAATTLSEPPRVCEVCGTVYEWKRFTSVEEFRQRRTCSRSCGLTLHYREHPKIDLLTGRTCVVCGDPFDQRRGERTRHYRQRLTCSLGCKGTRSVINGYRAGERKAFPPKTCPICQTVFGRDHDENVGDYRKRKTCSRECAGRLISRSKRHDPPEKWCLVCGQSFGRKRNESADRYRARKTCDDACRRRGQWLVRRKQLTRTRTGYPAGWTSTLRASIRERDGHRCRVCGDAPGRRPLQVHHISWNRDDCRPTNLVTLCTACHTMAHATRTRDDYRLMLSALIEAD